MASTHIILPQTGSPDAITSLTGDVTGTGPGAAATTISGLSAAKIATGLVTNDYFTTNSAPLKYVSTFAEDFHWGSGIGQFAAANVNSGTTTASGGSIITTNHHSAVTMSTGGTSNAGRSSIASSTLKLPSGYMVFEANVNIFQLSTVGEEFTFECGFGDQAGSSSNANTEGVWLRYDRLTSTSWLMCNGNGTLTNATAGTSATVTTGWVRLKFIIASDNSSVEFFMNDVSIGSLNTRMPSGTNNLRPYCRIMKSAGTTAVVAYVDYVEYATILSVPR